MNYVNHICRNKKCNNNWIDKDITNVTSLPASWKYCKECCEKLGIDFDSQQPSDYRTDEQNEKLKINMKKLRDKKLKH